MINELEILKLLVELDVRLSALQQKCQSAGQYGEPAGKVNCMRVTVRNLLNDTWIIKQLATESIKSEKPYDKKD